MTVLGSRDESAAPPRCSRSRSRSRRCGGRRRRRRTRASSSSRSMPSPGLQAGSVRGRRSSSQGARDRPRARARRRLGVKTVRFVNEPLFSKLVSGRRPTGTSPSPRSRSRRNAPATSASPRRTWSPTRACSTRKGLAPVPTTIAALAAAALQRAGDDGRRHIVSRIKPAKKPQLVANPSQLTYDLYNDRCDAIVFDAPFSGRRARRHPSGTGRSRADRDGRALRHRVPEGEPAAPS